MGATIILGGGIGKHLAFSALIPKLVEKYGELNIMSPWSDLFYNIPGVRRSVDHVLEYGYDDYFKNNERFSPEPYNNPDFFKKKIHLIEAFAREFGIEYDKTKDFPLPPYTTSQALTRIQEIKKAGKFIVFQFMGGNQAQTGKPNDKVMVKDYPPQLIEATIKLLKEKYPEYQLVNFGLPFEWNIEGTVSVGDLPYTAAPYLLAEAETFISIDSSLQHFSACQNVRKSGVVIWGATSPHSFGYDHNYNITNECPLKDQFCTRPYFQHTSDIVGKGMVWSCPSRSCINVSPEQILEYVAKIIKPVVGDTPQEEEKRVEDVIEEKESEVV